MTLFERILLGFIGLFVFFCFIFFIDIFSEKFGGPGIKNKIYIPISTSGRGIFVDHSGAELLNEESIKKTTNELLRKELLKEIQTWNLNYKKEDEEKILDQLMDYSKNKSAAQDLNTN